MGIQALAEYPSFLQALYLEYQNARGCASSLPHASAQGEPLFNTQRVTG
jgi:hypothetical protein